MKVLHVPFCYYPDPVGGTEVYVASLAQAQLKQGLDVAIAAPADRNGRYRHDGIDVFRFQTASHIDLRQLYGEGDPVAAEEFLEILKSWAPDLVHLHAFTSAISLKLVRESQQFGAPLVFTYHTPTVTCTRGTLLRWGEEVCDGRMDARQCARCTLHSMAVPRPVSWVLGSLPGRIGALAGDAGLKGGVWTALRMSELIGLRHQAAKGLFEQVDHVVAVAEWVRELLVRSGVPAEKITLSRQGLPYLATQSGDGGPSTPAASAARRLQFAFLGRLDPVKGVEILIDALRRVPRLAVSLDIYAVVQGPSARDMEARLLRKAAPDPRLRFLPPMAANEVVERLRDYDALLVPSQWLETGPLVVYEAFAAGIPVIGSNLGGIAELVTNGDNGILVEPHSDVSAWTRAITRFVENPDLPVQLKSRRRPVRTMEDAAADMQTVYEKAVQIAARVHRSVARRAREVPSR